MGKHYLPDWALVKDTRRNNLHLFDSVKVLTRTSRMGQTGRIIRLLKTKIFSPMVVVLFDDGKTARYYTESLLLVYETEDEKGKALSKIDSLNLMGAEITDSDFRVDRFNNDAFQFDDETQTWNVMLEDIADVDRLFGTFFETEQNDSYCNIYADVDKHCTKLAKPYLTVSMWLGDFCVEAVRPLSISEQKAVLSTIQKSYAKSDCEELLKEWMEASE